MNQTELFRLYSDRKTAILKQLFSSGLRHPSLVSMLSGHALRTADRELAEAAIPLVADKEERALKEYSLAIMDRVRSPLQVEPRVHLLILAYNRVRYVAQALRQLAATDYRNYAVYIIDNGSTDGTADILQEAKAFFPAGIQVSLERMPFNTGRPVGHNLLLTKHDHSQADFIAIGDDDLVEVPSDWLRMMVNTAEHFPEAAAIGGKAVSPGPDKIIHGGVRRLVEFEETSMSMTGDGEQADMGQIDYIDKVDHVIGCLHIYRKEALFKDIGLFDIRYSPCQCVDIDHHFRVRLAGYEIIYNGLVEFVHARAMGNEARYDKVTQGNSFGNLVKLLHKFEPEQMEKLMLDTMERRSKLMLGNC